MKQDYENYSDEEATQFIVRDKLIKLMELCPDKVANTLMQLNNYRPLMNISHALAYTVILLEHRGFNGKKEEK